MITLPLRDTDLEKLREIHEKFYQEEFNFPDFSKNWLSTFKIINGNNELITAGGIKLFPELVLLTDQNASASNRAFGLNAALQIATLVANNHDGVFCSVKKDSKWHEQLRSVGFRDAQDHNMILSLLNT